MLKAQTNDRDTVIDILTAAFDANRSVNFIVRQGPERIQRIRALMSYSFDICQLFGEIFITENGKGCALLLFPERKKFSIKTTLLDIQLAVKVIGVKNLLKVMKREAAIKKCHPKSKLYYLWFIGVHPTKQGNGTGSRLLAELKEHATGMNRTMCLETSTQENIPWYEKQGFTIYHALDLGYKLYFMKTDP